MKKFLSILVLLFVCTSIAFCYEMYSPSRYYYYPNGTYENASKRQTRFYKDYFERNKYECTKYYCYIPDDSDWGYILEKSWTGAIGYKWQEFMGVRERLKCHRTEDHMPVVKSFDEARYYKD